MGGPSLTASFQGFIDKLCEVFEMAEDMEMREEITRTFNIMKALSMRRIRHRVARVILIAAVLVMLNEHSIFEYVLRNNVVLKVCGMFECRFKTDGGHCRANALNFVCRRSRVSMCHT
jgi:hypothetical protein